MTDTATITITGKLTDAQSGVALAGQTLTFTDTNGETIPGAVTAADGSYSTTATVAPASNETFTLNWVGGVVGGIPYAPLTVTSDKYNIFALGTATINVSGTLVAKAA